MDSEDEQRITFSIDEIIEKYVGGFGVAQLFQVFVVAVGWAFDAQTTFLAIFTDAQPSWLCTNVTSLTAETETETCTRESSICEMDGGVWEWEKGKEASIISEWDLVCANTFKAAFPQLFFFVGTLLGFIMLGSLADSSLGRKRMLFISTLTISLTGFLTALAPNIWIYSLLRAITGFGKAPIGTCCLLLSTEIVGHKWRGFAASFLYFSCTLGFLSLPALAYLTRFQFSWRRTYIYISILPLLYCLLLLPFLWESPRWLLLRARSTEALQSLKKMAEINGKSVPDIVRLEDYSDTEKKTDWAPWLLWATKWARKRLGLTMAVGFGVGLLYFGLPLGADNLGVNLYLSVTFNALSEIPGNIISPVLVAKAERRRAILLLTFISGILCFLCALLSAERIDMIINSRGKKWCKMVGELGAFSCGVTAFNMLLVYCLELFPSNVRNSAMSMLRQAISFGAIVSPVIVVIGRRNPSLSFAIFGIAIIISGLFVIGLPETKDRPLYDTLEGQQRDEKVQEENESKNTLVSPLLS